MQLAIQVPLNRRHGAEGIAEVVSGERADDRMTLLCESDLHGGGSEQGAESDLVRAIVETLRETTTLRGEVRLVAPGSLPNDGKVIEDTRKLD